MIIRVLIINRQLVFAVTIKQALEQTGAFEVHPFTDPHAATEYLRTNPHDVALVDFDMTVLPGPMIVTQLRAVQPDLAIIASPAQLADVVRELGLQDTVDAPFSARGIIPVIENAAQQVSQPSAAVTRSFIQGDESVADTEILSDTHHHMVDSPQTRMFGAVVPHMPQDMPDDDDAGVPLTARLFDPEPENEVNTNLLGDPDTMLEDADADMDMPWQAASTEVENLPQTNILPSQPEPLPPAEPAAFSSLEHILTDEAPSGLYEPPVNDLDTPAVPDVAVDKHVVADDEADFGAVLDDLSADDADMEWVSSSEFDDLVNSMRQQTAHTPLPDRHQQFVEFILTGGMDGLISEIEQEHDPLDDVPDVPAAASDSIFQRLADEEPPLPTLEESGTVGDLMVGVTDTSFRHVLAMMRGDVVDLDDDLDEASIGPGDVQLSDTDYLEESAPLSMTDVVPVLPVEDDDEPIFPADEEDEVVIPARMILDTARDESSSLNKLIDDIERQLTEYKPDVVPLPSWQIQSFKPTPRRKDTPDEMRYVREPDFLPEDLPPAQSALPVEDVKPQLSSFFDVDDEDNVGAELFGLHSTPAQPESPHTEAEAIFDDMPQDPPWLEALDDSHFQETVVNPSLAVSSEIDDEPEAEPEFDPSDVFSVALPSVRDQLDEPFDESFAETVLQAPPAGFDWETLAADVPDVADEADTDTDTDDAPAYWQTIPAEDAPYHTEDEPPIEGDSVPLIVDDAWDDLPTGWDNAMADWEPGGQVTIDEPPADVEDTPVPVTASSSDGGWSLPEDALFAEPAGVEDEDAPADLDNAWSLDGLVTDETPDVPSELTGQAYNDAQIAQLALGLTQVSLELTAEATLLANADDIVAFAGQLEPADIDEIRTLLADDWDASDQEARVRFVTLPTTGKDYMIYSRRTVADFTLSMIFAGTMPLRDIRRQSKRLLDALAAIPAPDEIPDVAAVAGDESDTDDQPLSVVAARADVTAAQSFTYLWLMRDTVPTLTTDIARHVRNALELQLREMGWQVMTLVVAAQYMYVRADVPDERPAYLVVDELKRRAAQIIATQVSEAEDTANLWADSYLVVIPGRELDAEEIEQFIHFERML